MLDILVSSYTIYLLVAISVVKAQSGTCYYHNDTLPIPMSSQQAIFSASKNAVYFFGGQSGPQNSPTTLDKIWKWNMRDDSSWFTEIGVLREGLFSWTTNAALVNEEIFFIGIQQAIFSNDLLVYDLNTEAFSTRQRARKPATARSLGGCLASNSTHIFMVDGYVLDQLHPRPYIIVYDPAADVWESHVMDEGPATDEQGWWSQYCSVVGNALYVFGGQIGFTNDISDVYRIDLDTFYAEKLNATFPHIYGVSVYDEDHHLYLFGGQPYTTDIFSFNIDNHSLSTAEFSSQQLFSAAPVLVINDKMYRFGGERNYVITDKVEICEFPSSHSSTTTPTTTNPTTATPTSTTGTTTTGAPTTADPTTASPTTTNPTTATPTTGTPTTATPTTDNPTTADPTMVSSQTIETGSTMVKEYGEDVEETQASLPPQADAAKPNSLLWVWYIVGCIASVSLCFTVFGVYKCITANRNQQRNVDEQPGYGERESQLPAVVTSVRLQYSVDSDSEIEAKQDDVQAVAGEPDFEHDDSDDDNRAEGLRASVAARAATSGGLEVDEFEVVDDNEPATNGTRGE